MTDNIDRYLLCMYDTGRRTWSVYNSARNLAEVRERKVPGIKTRIFDLQEGEFINQGEL